MKSWEDSNLRGWHGGEDNFEMDPTCRTVHLKVCLYVDSYASLLAPTKTADTKNHVTLKQICMETVKHKLTTPKQHKHIYNWQALGCRTMPSMWVLLSFLAVPAYGIAFTTKAELRAAVVAWEANTERLQWDLKNDFICKHDTSMCYNLVTTMQRSNDVNCFGFVAVFEVDACCQTDLE